MNEPPNPEVAVFAAALELPAEKRPAYLDQACAGDAALRRQVEALLRVHDDAGDFFEKLASVARPTSAEGGISGPTGTIRLPSIPSEKSGEKIGRYKLLQQIGEGGCGVVYMAEQEEPVRRRVALKVIKLGMDTKSIIARFEAERQALALMDHPNIAKVLDAGATETGRPYFVMELVRGIKITDYCDENNLSTSARLELFIQICQAIQHAHQKGIIHRDIKPSNILVSVNDGIAVPKVIDFGIAKATQGRLTDHTLFTAFEQFLGTPAYMSPEQAVMTSLDIDTRSDIYSLGVLLYELLTSQTPFDAKELLKAGLDEIRRTIREQEPARPSTRLITMLGADLTLIAKHRQSEPPTLIHLLRGDLDWIVMKALEKDRTRRYETANGLAMDIQRHMENEPVQARPPSAGYRLQKSWQRNKTAFAVATLIAAVLMAATAISAWQAVRANHQARRALQAEALAQQRLVESKANEALATQRLADSEAISKFLTEVFQSPDPARDGRTITVAETLDAAARKLETDLANQPASRTKLQATLGSTYYALGLYPEAILLQEKVRDYCLATYGLEHTNTLKAMEDLAISYSSNRRLAEAIKLQEQVLALSRKVLGPEHPDTLRATRGLANSYDSDGRQAEALNLREQVLPLCRKVLGPENPETISALHNLAISYYSVGRRAEALKLREQVVSLNRKVLGPEHPNTIIAIIGLADSYVDAGRKDEALKLREEMLTLSRKVFGPEHPNTLAVMDNLAVSYYDVGRKDEALKLREEILTLSRKAHGPEHPDTLGAMNDVASYYGSLGHQAEALKLKEETLRLYQKVLGPEHLDTIIAMGNLAISYHDAGLLAEAIKIQEQVLALRGKVLGPEHPDTLIAMGNLASSYDDAGRLDEALKLREDALEISRKVLGPEHPDTLARINVLADAYDKTGHRDEALKLREQALPLYRKILGTENPGTLSVMNDLADSYDNAGRPEESLKLREEALTIRRKVLGPDNPGTLGTMNNLANSYDKASRREEALKLREEMLALRPKVSGATLAATLNEMNSLADSYCSLRRNKDTIALMEQACALDPKDRFESFRLATFQAWFGQDTDYESSRRQLVQQAEGTDQPGTADKAAKVFCLRPSTNSFLTAKALNLARQAVELRKSDPLLPWYELGLGLAEYRNGQYAAAEQALTIAEQTAGDAHDILGTARLFRAMSLLQQDQPKEARKVFNQAEAEMPPFPKDNHQPPAYDKSVTQDVLICWLAYKEAKALFEGSSAPK
jgi:serine/threonine protein kinase